MKTTQPTPPPPRAVFESLEPHELEEYDLPTDGDFSFNQPDEH
jgi:hypothetical protein